MVETVTRNETVRKIMRALQLTRGLYVSSILIGEPHTGKSTLIDTLFPEIPHGDGRDQEAVEALLSQHDAVCIEHYEHLPNPARLRREGKHIIALSDYPGNTRALDETFAFIHTMPPLRERPEDVQLLAEVFWREACDVLGVTCPQPVPSAQLDLHDNIRSLRASVYRAVLARTADREILEESLYHYFITALPERSGYHRHIGLFEKPLIEAGLHLYGSQLRLAEALGINRNTLRKKIHAHL